MWFRSDFNIKKLDTKTSSLLTYAEEKSYLRDP